MDIKILSREEWNSHPAVELVCQGHNDETPIYRLKAGWYYGDLSIPILKDGSVCADLFKWLSSEKYNRFFGVLKGMELPCPDSTKIIEDHFIFYGSRVYYHFIVDFLGSLQIHAISSILADKKILIGRDLPPQYKKILVEILSVYGYEGGSLASTDTTFFPFKNSFIQAQPAVADKIRNIRCLISKIELGPALDLRRIFVLRGLVRRRMLMNEKELAYMLVKDFGFSVVNPGKLDIKGQVRHFRNARVIVGVHGGALTNALFANNLKALVEINTVMYRPHLAGISSQLNARHFCLAAKPLAIQEGATYNEYDQNMDIDLHTARAFFRDLFGGKWA